MLTLGTVSAQAVVAALVRRVRTANGDDTVPAGKTTCTAHLLAGGGNPFSEYDPDTGNTTFYGGKGAEFRTGITFSVTSGSTVSFAAGAGRSTVTYAGSLLGSAMPGDEGGAGGTGGTGKTGGSGGIAGGGSAGGGGAAGSTGNGGVASGATGGVRGTGASFTDTETGVTYVNGPGYSASTNTQAGYGGGGGYIGASAQAAGGGFVVLEYT